MKVVTKRSGPIVGALLMIPCFCAAPLARSAEEGVIEGIVRFTDEVPQSRIVDNNGQRQGLLSVDRTTQGVRDVVLYLDVSDVVVEDPPQLEWTIDQIEHQFVPHVIAIRSGQRVKFTNSDAANHNVRAIALDDRNMFNVYTGVGGEHEHAFYAQRRGHPIRISCDIHPWMTAWIFAFEHPYFAVSDEEGRFRIDNVPAGEYRLVARQPDVGCLLRFDVTVESDKTRTWDFKITEDDLRVPGRDRNSRGRNP